MIPSLAEQLEQRHSALYRQGRLPSAAAADALCRAADVADALAALATQAGQPVLAKGWRQVAAANRAQASERRAMVESLRPHGRIREHLERAGQEFARSSQPDLALRWQQTRPLRPAAPPADPRHRPAPAPPGTLTYRAG